jgi:enolase
MFPSPRSDPNIFVCFEKVAEQNARTIFVGDGIEEKVQDCYIMPSRDLIDCDVLRHPLIDLLSAFILPDPSHNQKSIIGNLRIAVSLSTAGCWRSTNSE